MCFLKVTIIRMTDHSAQNGSKNGDVEAIHSDLCFTANELKLSDFASQLDS